MSAAVSPAEEPLVIASGVTRRFGHGDATVVALAEIDLAVAPGEFLAVRGASGSGKTTLLNVLGGLDLLDEGAVTTCGVDLTRADEAARLALRRDRIAYVFQTFGLLPLLSAAENVEVPLRLLETAPRERQRRVTELLDRVGLGARAGHRPHELSGGEQQRVAVARAVASRPTLLLADEPTAQLDRETAVGVVTWLRELVVEEGTTIVMATHETEVIDGVDRAVQLRDGRLTPA